MFRSVSRKTRPLGSSDNWFPEKRRSIKRTRRPNPQVLMASRVPRNPKISYLFTNLSTHFRSRRYSSNAAFEKLVQTRCKSRDLSVTEALGYFNSMLEMRPMPSIWALNQLFGSLSKSKQFSTVVYMYTHIAKFRPLDFQPDVSTLNIIVKCLARSNKAKLGFSVLGTMLKRGIGYDSHTLSTLLDGLCKEGSMVLAMELFEKIRIEEGSCDVVTYGTVISGFSRSGETHKAVEILNQMLEGQNGTKPDKYCFSLVIDCLLRDGLIDEAFSLFQKMIDLGVRPDTILYTSLIHMSCKFGRKEEANKLLLDMIDSGIVPDVFTYTVVINSLCKDGRLEAAVRFFGDMVSRGIVPNIFCYNTLIVGLSKLGNWKEVARILENMKVHDVSPNIVTFSSILDARFKEGNTMAALHLVSVMAEKGLVPDTVISSSLISGLYRSSISEEAKILSDTTASKDTVADIHTLNILLNGLSSGFMMLEARRLLEVMIDLGEVNTIAFTTVINGYCLQGEMGEAEEVFGKMEVNGVFPNTVTYNILANGYLKAERIDKALEILKDLILKGLRPDKATRTILKGIHAHMHESGLYDSRQGDDREVDMML